MLSRCFCLSFLSSLCTLAFISLYSFLSLCLASRFLSMRFSVSSVIQGFVRSFFLYPTISSAVGKTFFVSYHNSFGVFSSITYFKASNLFAIFVSYVYPLFTFNSSTFNLFIISVLFCLPSLTFMVAISRLWSVSQSALGYVLQLLMQAFHFLSMHNRSGSSCFHLALSMCIVSSGVV